jgi:hypothetical protein
MRYLTVSDRSIDLGHHIVLNNTSILARKSSHREVTVEQHSIDLGHHILLNNTSIQARKSRCRKKLMTEATEVKYHPTNMSREYNFSLSILWKSLVYSEGDKAGKYYEYL